MDKLKQQSNSPEDAQPRTRQRSGHPQAQREEPHHPAAPLQMRKTIIPPQCTRFTPVPHRAFETTTQNTHRPGQRLAACKHSEER
jgi:hypothetical protein